MKRRIKPAEFAMQTLFLICGLTAIAFVLLITVYLILAGLPAIREIGLTSFLFGRTWASTHATDPRFGILPMILTSVYGAAGAIVLGVPVGFFTALFLAKAAPPRLAGLIRPAVNLLAGIPSVVYGLVGMCVLVPALRAWLDLPAGDSLLASIIVLAVMILPSIISVSDAALAAVPREYEEASLALGATPVETYLRVTAPAARSGVAAAVVLIFAGPIGHALTAIKILQPYQLTRINVWLNPEAYPTTGGYQVLQGLYAIGSGGLFGKGLGESIQKLGFVPESQNDMIFAIICEELGLFGAVLVILLFVFMIYRFLLIAGNAPDLFGAMLVVGVMAHIAIQVILNIAVVTNTIPNTGITLPFISYGGTSVLFLMIEMGMVLSVSNQIKLER